VVDWHKKCVGEVFLQFELELNILGLLNAPADKRIKGLKSGERGGLYFEHCLRTYVGMNFFFFPPPYFVWETYC
jgi:hypothetical protein